MLEQFGYNNIKSDGKDAKGQRPLLIILVDVAQIEKHGIDGSTVRLPFAHNADYYDSLVFGSQDSRLQTVAGHRPESVVDYYRDISNGRFTWTRAAPALGPLQLSVTESILEPEERLARILTIAVEKTGFDFNKFETSENTTITNQELGILLVENNVPSASGGITRGSDPGIVSIKAPYGTQTLAVSAAFVGHRAGFMTICHELCHVLGTGHDLYGASGLNQNCTLMDATAGTPDDPETYHLDPWHKLQYGWSEPRIRTLDSFGPIELPAANMGDPEAPVIIYDPKHGTNEYFILEYRSSLNPAGSMYDKNVNSNGLAIWHVITDQNKSPMEIPSLAVVKRRAEQTLAGTDKSVFLDGAPDLARGGNTLWVGDQVTPPLRWLDKAETDPEPEFPELRWDGDGSPTGTRIKVWPFHPTDASITVELILNVVDEFHGSQEASTHVSDVQTMGKFHGIQDHPAGSRSGKGIGEN